MNLHVPTDRLWTSADVEAYLKVAPGWAAKDRCGRALIPFVRIGSRAVRYRREDVERYIKTSIRKSTCDTGSADVAA